MCLIHQDWPYPDGDPPPDQIIESWLALVQSTFAGDQSKSKIVRVLSKATSSSKPSADNGIIGIHCIAGLGRSIPLYYHLADFLASHPAGCLREADRFRAQGPSAGGHRPHRGGHGSARRGAPDPRLPPGGH